MEAWEPPKIGINGFGRIGRFVLRAALRKEVSVVAINDPYIRLEHMVYLFKFDSTHGRYKGKVSVTGDQLVVDDHPIAVFNSKRPEDVDWGSVGTKYVLECTGVFTSVEKAAMHLHHSRSPRNADGRSGDKDDERTAAKTRSNDKRKKDSKSKEDSREKEVDSRRRNSGPEKVVVTFPSTDVPTLLMGINHKDYKPKGPRVVSAGNAALYCVATLLKAIDDKFGIQEGIVSVIQSLTGNQRVVDGPQGWRVPDWREGRGAMQNIIPVISPADAKFIAAVLPSLKNRIKSVGFKVPVEDVSVVDVTLHLKKEAREVRICEEMEAQSHLPHLKSTLEYTEEPMVSSDFRGNTNSCIFDRKAMLYLNNRHVKLVAWYDNEISFSERVVDLINYMAKRDEETEAATVTKEVSPRSGEGKKKQRESQPRTEHKNYSERIEPKRIRSSRRRKEKTLVSAPADKYKQQHKKVSKETKKYVL